MAVDFTITNIISVIAQTVFDGNTTIAGLAIMLLVAFIMIAILANIKAPVQYSLVPIIILAIIFASMGIMDTTVSFIVIIISAVVVATGARNLVGS